MHKYLFDRYLSGFYLFVNKYEFFLKNTSVFFQIFKGMNLFEMIFLKIFKELTMESYEEIYSNKNSRNE